MTMDTKKPYPGLIFLIGKFTYKVVEIEGFEIKAIRLNPDGSESQKYKSWNQSQWPPENYVESSMESGKTDSNPLDTNNKKNEKSKYFFEYDDEKQEIVVRESSGIEVGRLSGLYGPTGLSFYEDWARHSHKDPKSPETWKEFEDSFKGRDGISTMGENGKSAFEIWSELQPADHRSKEEYFNYLKGKKGVEGESAYQLWLRLYPHEGKVTEEDFFRWIAAQVPAVEGAMFIPSVDADGKLYFINSRTGERTQMHSDVRGKNGKTFRPVLSEHYLWFEDENGYPIGPKVNLKGDKGDKGEIGKSAYELWRNDPLHPENTTGTLDDYRQSLHGLDGHNVKAEYDFTTLEDYTCPIETINPHMIASADSLQGTDSAEQTIAKEQAKIRNLRREGEELKNHGSWIQEFFWWCAGADSPLLRMCPGEHSKYMGIGTIIFFTALMAWFSSYVALKLVTGEDKLESTVTLWGSILPVIIFGTLVVILFLSYKLVRFRRTLDLKEIENKKTGLSKKITVIYRRVRTYIVILSVLFIAAIILLFCEITPSGDDGAWKNISWAAVFACVWSLMIFFLDRFITNTMYSDGKVSISWLELRSAFPRIIIAIFLGIVISAPLELIIFEKEIDLKLNSLEIEYADTCCIDIVGQIRDLKRQIDSLETNKQKREDRANKNVDINQQMKDENIRHRGVISNIDKQLPIDKNQPSGTRETNPTGWKSYDARQEDRLSARSKELSREDGLHAENMNRLEKERDFDTSTETIKKQLLELQGQLNTLKLQKDTIRTNATKEFKQSIGLGLKLEALHSLAYQEGKDDGYKAWNTSFYRKNPFNSFYWFLGILLLLISVTFPFYKNVVSSGNKKEGALVVIPWLVVVAAICGYCNNILFNALPSYIFSAVGMIMMLFILIDVSPVFYKMMLADGIYDKLLHKDKLLTQDAMRLDAAKAYAKVNDSEVGRLAPFIFGKTAEKIEDFLNHPTLKSADAEGENGKPELGYGTNSYTEDINRNNKEVFNYVLNLKKRLVQAAYLAWYREMRDVRIGANRQHDPIQEDVVKEFPEFADGLTPPPSPGDLGSPSGSESTSEISTEESSADSTSDPNSTKSTSGTTSETNPDEDGEREIKDNETFTTK